MDGWMDGSGSEIILQNQVPPYSQCSLLRAASKRRSDQRQVAVWGKLVLSLLAFQGHANWGCLLNNVYVYIIYIIKLYIYNQCLINWYQVISNSILSRFTPIFICMYNYFKSIQMINVVPSPHSDFGLRKTKAREGGGGDHHRWLGPKKPMGGCWRLRGWD